METIEPSNSGQNGLPYELWSAIIDAAALAPTELGIAEWTGGYDPLDLGRSTISDLTLQTTLLKKEIQFRLNLFLVSHLWNEVTRKHLYRSVALSKSSHLVDFLNLLDASPSLGLLVKRLDITYFSLASRKSSHQIIEKILEFCPNLLLIVDPSEGEHPSCDWIIKEIKESHIFSKFEIQQLRLIVQNADFIPIYPPLLSCFHHLRALYLTTFDISDESTVVSLPQLSLPSLELLDLSRLIFSNSGRSVDEYLAGSSLPNLHSLTLAIMNVPSLSIKQFLETFGPQIRTLNLTDWIKCTPDVYDLFVPTVPSFPNLEQLMVPVHVSRNLLSEFAKIITIRRLAIHWDSGSSPSLFQSDGKSPLFQNVQSIYIMGLPNKKTKNVGLSSNIKILGSLFSYLDINRRLFQSFSIALGIKYTGTHHVIWTDNSTRDILSKLF